MQINIMMLTVVTFLTSNTKVCAMSIVESLHKHDMIDADGLLSFVVVKSLFLH